MAARALEILTNAIIKPYTVATSKTAVAHCPVKHSGADDAVEKMAAVGDNIFGIALEAGSAGDVVRVVLLGYGICKVLVGTGGATYGSFAKWVTGDGTTDATIGGGTVKLVTPGQYLQSGDATHLVGLNLGMAAPTVGS